MNKETLLITQSSGNQSISVKPGEIPVIGPSAPIGDAVAIASNFVASGVVPVQIIMPGDEASRANEKYREEFRELWSDIGLSDGFDLLVSGKILLVTVKK